MSWFWRGFQSAVFYYVSCAPCSKLNTRRKRRSEFRRAKAEKVELNDTFPELYRHPSPFSTNLYWREEMALGPGPPPKKGNHDKGNLNGSSRELTTGGIGSSTGGSSGDTTLAIESENGTDMESSENGEGWNKRRYQRSDEVLWGVDIGDSDHTGDTSDISRAGTAASGYSYTARNPAVNDLHPPVVSTQPTHKNEIKWMLQPPPSAKVMEGKERANRSRSGSGGSNGSSKRGADTASLGKQIGERIVEGKVRRGESPSIGQAPSLHLSDFKIPDMSSDQRDVQAQRHDRDLRTADESSTGKRRRPVPITLSEDKRRYRSHANSEPPYGNDTIPRPHLPTIESASNDLPVLHRLEHSARPKNLQTKATRLRPSLDSTTSTSSLHVLQELISPNSALNMRAPSPSKEAAVRLPSATEAEEKELRLPECESWFPGRDFRFPSRSAGHDRKDFVDPPRMARWSMDI
ncbi:hypothetical protein MMC14_004926 [Varicellaria rhodocarpa]|nr:hypothetical protein [Varicellaria rhodocarpa]